MAIFHLNISIISRGQGHSAVCAAAYTSRDKIRDLFLGYEYDFTHKAGLVYDEILLPRYAPAAFAERATLWNAVEQAEKNINAQLAREIILALPIELSWEERIKLTRKYVQKNFVSKGMCADICFHDGDGENPHVHILLTTRPFQDNGEWGAKSKMEYVFDKNGERVLLPSGRPKTKKIKYTDWDEQSNAERWRKSWADFANRSLEENGFDIRIDHRSYEDQGIDIIPSVHLGSAAHAMEKRGIATERGDINRAIAESNAKIRAWNDEIRELEKQRDALSSLDIEESIEPDDVSAHTEADSDEPEIVSDEIPAPQILAPQVQPKPQPIFDTEDSAAPDDAPRDNEETDSEIENPNDEASEPQALEPKTPLKPQPIFVTKDSPAPDEAQHNNEATDTEFENSDDETPEPQAVEPQVPESKPANIKPPTSEPQALERQAPERPAPTKPKLILDLEDAIKSEGDPGYEHWARIFDSQQVVQTLAYMRKKRLLEMDDLKYEQYRTECYIVEVEKQLRNNKSSLESVETMKWYFERYRATRDVYKAYTDMKKSGKKDYYTRHHEEIEKHKSARKYFFKDLKLEKIPSLKKMSEDIRELRWGIKQTEMHLEFTHNDLKELSATIQNVETLLAYRDFEKRSAVTTIPAVDLRFVDIHTLSLDDCYNEKRRTAYFQNCALNRDCAAEIIKAMATNKPATEAAEEILLEYGKERVERVVASIVINAPEKIFSKKDRLWAIENGQHSRFFKHSAREYSLFEKFVQPFRDTLSRMKKTRDPKDNFDKWVFRDKDEPSPTTPKKINLIHKPPPQRKKQITRTRNDNNALEL